MKQRSSDPSHSHQRSVRFDRLEVIQFQPILGDNPSCSSGAPLTLDWKPVEQSTMLIDFYEFTRVERRSRAELAISKSDRQLYLLEAGYSLAEICAAQDQVAQIKHERIASAEAKNQNWGVGFFSVAKSAAKTFTNPTKHFLSKANNKQAVLSARSA